MIASALTDRLRQAGEKSGSASGSYSTGQAALYPLVDGGVSTISDWRGSRISAVVYAAVTTSPGCKRRAGSRSLSLMRIRSDYGWIPQSGRLGFDLSSGRRGAIRRYSFETIELFKENHGAWLGRLQQSARE